MTAFRREARAPERRAVKKEWSAFRAATEGETLKAVGEKLTRGLGGAWTPRKRADLDTLDALDQRSMKRLASLGGGSLGARRAALRA